MSRPSRRTTAVVITAATVAAFAIGGTMYSNAATTDHSKDVATIGWAMQSGGTSGGSAATAAHTYTVSTRAQLLAALAGTDSAGKTNKTAAKIIKWVGSIDMTEGKKFTSHADQLARGQINVTANTTIIGVGSTAYLPNGWFYLKGVSNIIVRNIKVTNPCDITPIWDPTDSGGNYNSEFDGMTVDNSTHVWVDHMLFTDAPYTDDKEPLGNKNSSGVAKHIQCHDGALDIKKASDFVTVSNTIFDSHQKNNLVGHSDSYTADDGHLKVTFAYDEFTKISERSPRVRFGQVHVLDNYYLGSKSDSAYPYSYSIGTAYKSKIISTNNVFEISGITAGKCSAVTKNPGSSATGAFVDSGSTVNGSALSGCTQSSSVGWTVPYKFTNIAAASVKSFVLANAGVGKI